jgi:hypothetical protein
MLILKCASFEADPEGHVGEKWIRFSAWDDALQVVCPIRHNKRGNPLGILALTLHVSRRFS